VLLCQMGKLGLPVIAEAYRMNEQGVPLVWTLWTMPSTVHAEMKAKKSWTREDAITTAALMGIMTILWGTGHSCVFELAGYTSPDFLAFLTAEHPYRPSSDEDEGRYIPLALVSKQASKADKDHPAAARAPRRAARHPGHMCVRSSCCLIAE
jgi:hypothetical protein